MTGSPDEIRVLALTRYPREGASSRLRFLQYVDPLRRHGVQVAEANLFDSAYLRSLYAQGSRSARNVLLAYVRRLQQLAASHVYDVIWLEKEMFPWLPALGERLMSSRTPIVVDYDDAWFHNYDLHPRGLVRHLLGNKIDNVMRYAHRVVAGNHYLADRASRAGAKRTSIVPTVVDADRYPLREFKTSRLAADPLIVGWIGSPSTAKYLELIARPLAVLSARRPVILRVVGADHVRIPGVDVECRPWSEATEAAEIASFHVGIMPLENTPWERGKCGYKLVQYMASGLPCLASPVGVNTEVINHGVTGLLCEGPTDWSEGLETLARDADLGVRMGWAGRQRFQTHYSLQAAAPVMAQILLEAAGLPPRSGPQRVDSATVVVPP